MAICTVVHVLADAIVLGEFSWCRGISDWFQVLERSIAGFVYSLTVSIVKMFLHLIQSQNREIIM